MNSQLDHAIPDRLAISKIPNLNPPQTNANTRRGGLISQGVEPLGKRFTAIVAPISK
jgi:hypothetical protein